MTDDPIIAEVRQARQEHAARFDYDLRRIFDDLKASEKGRDGGKSPLLEAPEKSTLPPNASLQRARFARR